MEKFSFFAKWERDFEAANNCTVEAVYTTELSLPVRWQLFHTLKNAFPDAHVLASRRQANALLQSQRNSRSHHVPGGFGGFGGFASPSLQLPEKAAGQSEVDSTVLINELRYRLGCGTLSELTSGKPKRFNVEISGQAHAELEDFIVNCGNVRQLLFSLTVAMGVVNAESRSTLESLVNKILTENLVAYQVSNLQILPLTSTYTYVNEVEPCLAILQNPNFRNADLEFRQTFACLSEGNHSEALVNAGKSLESVIKVLCENQGITLRGTEGLSQLIDLLVGNEIIPEYLASSKGALTSLLKSTVPTLRNRNAHGAGSSTVDASEHLVHFSINSAANAILLLVSLSETKDKQVNAVAQPTSHQ